jgi:Flp pilus assembly protein TadG
MRSLLKSRRNNRGNAILEAALVFLPLFALIFAIVDFGFAMFLRSTFQHAVREGCRYAVTSQTTGGLGHDASIGQVVKYNALGFLNSSAVGSGAGCTICVRYFDPDNGNEVAANAPGNIVQVSVENYGWTWIAPIWRTSAGLTINARAADRMEGLGPGMLSPAR